MFQSTPARGGRQPDALPYEPRHGSFNPRPHAAGDSDRSADHARRIVSIHARTRRATALACGSRPARLVSIHARTRRATTERRPTHGRPQRRFNPRPHAAGDRLAATVAGSRHAVSIHARTRRATAGARQVSSADSQFQSTPARGGRLAHRPASPAGACCFNPRPHAAGDGDALVEPGPCDSFQSTPARGGRRDLRLDAASTSIVSIHARTRRATRGAQRRRYPDDVSIHARTRRATRGQLRWQAIDRRFNPRPHAAGDAVCRRSSDGARLVSIHARTRRATSPADAVAPARVVSIHARTRRATADAAADAAARMPFQSTPARGGRPATAEYTALPAMMFQSTPARGGRRHRYGSPTPRQAVSIHARTRRATGS